MSFIIENFAERWGVFPSTISGIGNRAVLLETPARLSRPRRPRLAFERVGGNRPTSCHSLSTNCGINNQAVENPASGCPAGCGHSIMTLYRGSCNSFFFAKPFRRRRSAPPPHPRPERPARLGGGEPGPLLLAPTAQSPRSHDTSKLTMICRNVWIWPGGCCCEERSRDIANDTEHSADCFADQALQAIAPPPNLPLEHDDGRRRFSNRPASSLRARLNMNESADDRDNENKQKGRIRDDVPRVRPLLWKGGPTKKKK